MKAFSTESRYVTAVFFATIIGHALVSADHHQVPTKCLNDPNFWVRYHTPYITRSATCSWVGQNNPSLCFQEDVNEDGVLIGEQCAGQCPEISGCPVQPPTNGPTHIPTVVPTLQPTLSPTLSPISFTEDRESSSDSPSQVPTPTPSYSLSDYPSVTPSGVPSTTPSVLPTTAASLEPSESPEVAYHEDVTTTETLEPTPPPRLRTITMETKEMSIAFVNATRMTEEELRTWSRLTTQWFESFYSGTANGVERKCTTAIDVLDQIMTFDANGEPTNTIHFKQTISFTYAQSSLSSSDRIEHLENEKQRTAVDLRNLTSEQVAAQPYKIATTNSRLTVNLRFYLDSFHHVRAPISVPEPADPDVSLVSQENSSGIKWTISVGIIALFGVQLVWLY